MKTLQILFLILTMASGTILNSCTVKEINSHKRKNKIIIFSASGSRIAVDEICNVFEKNTKIRILRNYASSGILARQIENGAHCDLFISANKQWIEYLQKNKLIKCNQTHIIAQNSLVVVTPKKSNRKKFPLKTKYSPNNFSGDIIAIGNPAFVPVGKYTKEVLEKLHWYQSLINKAILAKDVSSVLHYVELGECDWGIVYYTEAIQSSKVKILSSISKAMHSEINFYIAQTTSSHPAAIELNKIFIEEIGQSIFAKYGFRSLKKRHQYVRK